MLKAYVASTNKVKVNAVKEVLSHWSVESMDVPSGVSSQPFGEVETIQGAINRAKNLPNDGLRIGLEGGVSLITNPVTLESQLYVINYGALIDQDENIYIAGGARIPLPNEIKERLMNENKVRENLELGDVMNEYTRRNDIKSTTGAIGIFTSNQIDRTEMFKHIVKILYGEYLFKNFQKEEL